jgi:hypothetical protein
VMVTCAESEVETIKPSVSSKPNLLSMRISLLL